MSADEALLLIGHGSVRYPDAGSAMRRHADLVRLAKCFARVEIALLNGSPSVPTALALFGQAAIRVVPFFMEDGFFSRVAVPRAIRSAMSEIGASVSMPGTSVTSAEANSVIEAGTRRIMLCPPVGTHDDVAGIIERQALAGCRQLGVASRTVAVVVVGHGSSSAPGRALALHRHASRVAATGQFARVEAACLEEAPFVADTLRMLHAHPVVVIGFFANHGGHVRDDVPGLIAAEQAARSSLAQVVVFHGCVSDDPAMARIIVDRATRTLNSVA